jgi:hypothetical protein
MVIDLACIFNVQELRFCDECIWDDGKNQHIFFEIPHPTMSVKEPNFLYDPSKILKALLTSRDLGTSIAIRADIFGPETIITAVEDIQLVDEQTIIILKYFDSCGYILPSYKLNFLEVQAVFPFTTLFVNPYLQNLQEERTWFF